MRDKSTAGLLALLLGGVGGHKFYLGKTGTGVVYVLFCWTFIPALIAFIEAIVLFSMDQQVFNLKYNQGLLLAAPQQNFVAAPSVNVVVQNTNDVRSGGSVTSDLKALHELKQQGALTEDEFAREKQKLLSRG